MRTRPGVMEMIRRTQRQGVADTGKRVVRRLYSRMDAASLEFPLLEEDIADSSRLRPFAGPVPGRSSPTLTVGWVCTPPSPGSGGHTTLFRMVAGLERQGHRCVVYLYDRNGGDLQRHVSLIRRFWPDLKAEIRDATKGLVGADAYVASSWESAHVIASRAGDAAARLYFIQDFEPFFYPRGTLYAMAEDSYRFGFRNIALGEMVARELEEIGVDCVRAPFGCDTSVYSLTNETGRRSGVVYYTKPGSDRRGYILGRLALEEFHRRHPEEPVHLYGDAGDDWKIPTVQHGRLSPEELNTLYNGTKAGLAISFTNITLVAEEMLAAGNIPVVTQVPHARAVLPNENVVWARPTPGSLADALCSAVEAPTSPERRADIARSVRQGWGPTLDAVADAITRAVGHRADEPSL
jgi:glycosyltransferase involved in cell wall biosynthesis